MRRLVFGIALLFGLVLAPSSVHAQGSVTLSVCNAGKVDIDVFLSRAGKVSNWRIGPSDCAIVAEGAGAMEPAYVGFAFSDTKGQWGAAKRFNSDLLDGMKRVNQTATVRHGTANVSLPLQFLFSPRAPECTTDSGRSTAGNFTEYRTRCDQLRFTVNLQVFPETREIAFHGFCDPCDQKANPGLTAEQRAIQQSQRDAARIRDMRLSTGSLVELAVLTRNLTVVDVAEVGSLLSRREPPQPVNWSVILPALRKRRNEDHLWDLIPRNIVIRGTVAKVEVLNPTDPDDRPLAHIAFRESPPVADNNPRFAIPEFTACTTNPDIFQDLFGADFRTSMIGKTIEVEGESWGAGCGSLRGSVRFDLARQIRAVRSAQFAAGTPVWTPPEPVQDDDVMKAVAWSELQQRLYKKHQSEFDTCKQRFEEATKAAKVFSQGPGEEYNACVARFSDPEKQQKYTACQEPYEKAVQATPAKRAALQKQFLACMDALLSGPAAAPAIRALAPAPAQPIAQGARSADPTQPVPPPPVQTPSGGATQAAAPAAAPDSSAAARAKTLQEQQERAAQDRAATQKRLAQEAQQRNQKAQACVQQLLKAYPDGGRSDPGGFQKGYLACVQPQPAK